MTYLAVPIGQIYSHNGLFYTHVEEVAKTNNYFFIVSDDTKNLCDRDTMVYVSAADYCLRASKIGKFL